MLTWDGSTSQRAKMTWDQKTQIDLNGVFTVCEIRNLGISPLKKITEAGIHFCGFSATEIFQMHLSLPNLWSYSNLTIYF